MKATFSVEAPSGETITIISHTDPPSAASRLQILEFIGSDGQPALTMSWAYGADFTAAAGVPVTITADGHPRHALFKNGQIQPDTAATDPAFSGDDMAALTPLRDTVQTVFAPANHNPFLAQGGADDDALGTITGSIQIGATIVGGLGFAAGAKVGGLPGAAVGAGAGAAVGASIGLQVGVGIVVVQAAVDAFS